MALIISLCDSYRFDIQHFYSKDIIQDFHIQCIYILYDPVTPSITFGRDRLLSFIKLISFQYVFYITAFQQGIPFLLLVHLHCINSEYHIDIASLNITLALFLMSESEPCLGLLVFLHMLYVSQDISQRSDVNSFQPGSGYRTRAIILL